MEIECEGQNRPKRDCFMWYLVIDRFETFSGKRHLFRGILLSLCQIIIYYIIMSILN